MTDGVFVFALLPLGLLSFLHWRESKGTVAGLAWLAALAPLVISGVKAIAGHKSKKNQEKAAQENARYEAEQAEAQRRQAFEQEQSSPQAQMNALQYKLRLGKLAGKMGGLDKVPPSILNALKSGYAAKQYQAGPGYRAPKTGGSAWDWVSPATEALSTVDWGGMKDALSKKPYDAAQAGADAVAAGGGLNKGFQAPAPIQTFQQSQTANTLFGGADRFKKKPGDVF